MTFEPMTEVALRACKREDRHMSTIIESALAYCARAEQMRAEHDAVIVERDALAERIGFLQVERDTVWNQADTFRAERDAEQKSRRKLDAEIRAILHIASDVSVLPVLRERLTGWGAVSRAKKAAEEARDLAVVERDEVRNDLSKARAFARGLSANIVAAEEARDLAIAERDEAYKQRDTMRAERDAAVERAESCEGDVQDANRTASNARRTRERMRDEVSALESQIEDARAILGARPDEMLSDAAQRVKAHSSRYWSWVNECALSIGETHHSNVPDRVSAVMAELTRLREGRDGQVRAANEDAARARDAMQRMKAEHAGELAVARMDAAEAEPAQTFRPHFEVMIGPDCADRPCATLRLVQPIRDPAFMALTADQLSRLGLVVCDE